MTAHDGRETPLDCADWAAALTALTGLVAKQIQEEQETAHNIVEVAVKVRGVLGGTPAVTYCGGFGDAIGFVMLLSDELSPVGQLRAFCDQLIKHFLAATLLPEDKQ